MLSFWTPKALAGLRIVASLLFIEHGTQKLFGFPTPIHGMPPILSPHGIGGCLPWQFRRPAGWQSIISARW